ncbi:MAG: T9SS type A sorting domain-containing protein, partial [Thermotogota bacterium]|nr:T9SS type A sorting domain-containing protein [Thermotogota bacterium]
TRPPAILLCPASEYPYFNTHVEYGYVNEDYYLYAYRTNLSNNDADYKWRFYSSDPFELPVLGQGRQIEFSKSTPGDYIVSLQYDGVCGWSNETFETIRFEYNVRFGLLMFPNPATEETTLSIESIGSIAYNEDELWEVEIYSSSMILKVKKNKIKGKEVKIKTSGWKTGIYFVRAKYKDLILEDKLIIK